LYALVFAAGLDPAPGITLLFQVFPLALSRGVTGSATAILVYLVLFMTTLVAAMALMEPAVRYCVERLRITRVSAATRSAILIWFLGLGTLLSFNLWQTLGLLSWNLFDGLQWLTGRVLLPVVGLLLCIFISRLLPEDLMNEIWGESSPKLRTVWQWLMRFPARLILIALLLYCIGIVDVLVDLWTGT
ncbi:MAG: sodium-dependent transporter, partial [Nevskiales bacterium]|nr:sodium-dependent transporter [Nevskiales bacterium]